MITDPEAVFKAYPNAVRVNPDGAWDSSNNKITIVQSNVDAARVELAKLDYQWKRNYPSIQDQLDMQYWDKKNGTTTWVDAIAKVKSDNPKP